MSKTGVTILLIIVALFAFLAGFLMGESKFRLTGMILNLPSPTQTPFIFK